MLPQRRTRTLSAATALALIAPHVTWGDVGRYAPFELALTNTRTYANAFVDTTLTATFTSASQQQRVVEGFYDGGQTWRVRFMPDQIGQWSYAASFSDGAPGSSGAFQCVSSPLHGPIEVNTTDDNSKQWFRHADGTPFYMRSFHLWFVDRLDSRGHLTDTLDFLEAQGFNTVNGPHLAPEPSGGSPAQTLAPWLKAGATYDFSRFNLTEWQRLDTVLTQMASRGMVLVPFSIMLGTNGQPKIPPGAKRDLFLRYWVARWGGFWNATFQPFSEWEEDYSESEVLQILDRIRELDGGRHLISVHPLYRGSTGVQNSASYSYHTIQDKLGNYNDYMKYVNTFGGLYYWSHKPMLAHECLWEGNMYQGNVGLNMEEMRRAAWVIALTAGHINYCDEVIIPRGYQTTYFEGSFSVLGKEMEPQGWLYPYLAILGDFMESLPLARMGQNSLVSSTRTCLLIPGSRYVTYAPNGGAFTLDLAGAPGTFEGRWFNPRTGGIAQAVQVQGGGVQSIAAPDTHDWVFDLALSGQDQTPPAPVSGFTASGGPRRVTLEWTNPPDLDFAGTSIRYSTTVYPTSPTDGSPVVEGAGTAGSAHGYLHTGLIQGTTCYYSAFAHDWVPNYASAVHASALVLASGDMDRDGDVDQEDFGAFQACISGTGLQRPPGCEDADANTDGDVDQDDFAAFQSCMSGPNVPPEC